MDHGLSSALSVISSNSHFLRVFRIASGPLAVFSSVFVATSAHATASTGDGGLAASGIAAAVISSTVVLAMWCVDRFVNRKTKINDLTVRQLELIERAWEDQRKNWADDLDRADRSATELRTKLADADIQIGVLTTALREANDQLERYRRGSV